MRSLNVGCGPHLAPDPWVNVDVFTYDAVRPDVVTNSFALPFLDGVFGRVYCGHVLEHVPWEQVPRLLVEIRRVMSKSAQLLVVGPDVKQTIMLWHQGEEPWEQVALYLENDVGHQEVDGPAARHQWNCDEGRLVRMLSPLFDYVEPVPVLELERYDEWPITSYALHQCAVLGQVL